MGRVVKAHGLRGEVTVYPITSHPERRFVPGSVLQTDEGPMEVHAGRPHQAMWLVTFAGVADRTSAESLRGRVLRAEPLDGEDEPDALWVHELIGAEVLDTEGRVHGRVEAVEANPASDLLVLDGERLVPLVFVVSHEPGRVVIDPPAGLLED